MQSFHLSKGGSSVASEANTQTGKRPGCQVIAHIRHVVLQKSAFQACLIVKTVEWIDLVEMRKTDTFGETRLVPHVNSSSRAGKRIYYYYYYEA